MSIKFDSFLNWAESHFDSVIVKGDEIKLNSIFTEDYKNKMWCSPSGGRHKREGGVYHCWKTDSKGTLVSLVMKVDNCPYDEAIDTLGGDESLANLEEKIKDFFANKESNAEGLSNNQPPKNTSLELPENTFLISSLPKNDINGINSKVYLNDRKIPHKELMVCTYGKYKNRIIIPYYDKEGKLIYFNSRSIERRPKIRYLGPPKEIGVGKGDVIFMSSWPDKESRVYLTEGEFDALSLSACGLNGAACGGKYLTSKQVAILSDYKVSVCLDNDNAGLDALKTVGDNLVRGGLKDITFIRPPKGIKDWNSMLINYDKDILKAYILKNGKTFDMWSSDLNDVNRF